MVHFFRLSVVAKEVACHRDTPNFCIRVISDTYLPNQVIFANWFGILDLKGPDMFGKERSSSSLLNRGSSKMQIRQFHLHLPMPYYYTFRDVVTMSSYQVNVAHVGCQGHFQLHTFCLNIKPIHPRMMLYGSMGFWK